MLMSSITTAQRQGQLQMKGGEQKKYNEENLTCTEEGNARDPQTQGGWEAPGDPEDGKRELEDASLDLWRGQTCRSCCTCVQKSCLCIGKKMENVGYGKLCLFVFIAAIYTAHSQIVLLKVSKQILHFKWQKCRYLEVKYIRNTCIFSTKFGLFMFHPSSWSHYFMIQYFTNGN